jgi:hypothetical protein
VKAIYFSLLYILATSPLIAATDPPPSGAGRECGKLDLLSDTGDLDAGVDSSAILIEGTQVLYCSVYFLLCM